MTELLERCANFDEAEALLARLPQVECPVVHRFTPGLYIREITMPAGAIVTSAIHKTEHPFVISKGRVRVVSETEGAVEYAAPHGGVTLPGTRRMLYVLEETVWTTFHVTELTDPRAIGEAILEDAGPIPLDNQQWRQWLLEGGDDD